MQYKQAKQEFISGVSYYQRICCLSTATSLATNSTKNFSKVTGWKDNEFPTAPITQHGSWNRSVLSGYKVVFMPFKNGVPDGPVEDFLGGFEKNLSKSEVNGRPAGIALLQDGSMMVSDDVSNILWRISFTN